MTFLFVWELDTIWLGNIENFSYDFNTVIIQQLQDMSFNYFKLSFNSLLTNNNYI